MEDEGECFLGSQDVPLPQEAMGSGDVVTAAVAWTGKEMTAPQLLGGDWSVNQTVSTARKMNSMGGSASALVTGGTGADSATRTGFSNINVPTGTSETWGNSINTGGVSTGAARGSDSSASSAQPAMFS